MALKKEDATATIKKENGVLVLNCGSINAGKTYNKQKNGDVKLDGKLDWGTGLKVYNVDGIQGKSRILKYVVDNPNAMNGDWRVAFSDSENAIRIFGKMNSNKSTKLTLYLI